MDSGRESLLDDEDRTNDSPTLRFISYNIATKLKRNLLLLLVSFLIATCLTIYVYLNLVAIDDNQTNSSSRYKPLSRRKPMLNHESIFSDSGPSMIKLSDLLAHCIVALQVAGKEVVKLSLNNRDQLSHVGSKGKTLEGVDDVVTGADLKSHQMILNTIKDSYRRLKIVSEEDTTLAFENTSIEDDILPIDRKEFANMLRENLHDIEGQRPERNFLIDLHETLVWIDPLDATKEYSENLTEYVTLMACIVHKSTPIAGVIHKPFNGLTYWSMKDDIGKSHYSTDLKNLLGAKSNNYKQANIPLKVIVSRSHAGDVKNVLQNIYKDNVDIVSAGGSGFKTIELIGGRVDAYLHMTQIKKWDICAPHAIVSSIPGGMLTDSLGQKITFGDPNEEIVTEGVISTLDRELHDQISQSILSSHRD